MIVGWTGTLTVGATESSGDWGVGCPHADSASTSEAETPSTTGGTAYARGEPDPARLALVAGRGRPGMGTCGPFLSRGVRRPLCPAGCSGQQQPGRDGHGDDEQPRPERHRVG
ncbi:hypothetical protein GCM10009817_23870 [Terrabacter lapilli]|uniref:Uncharacterized protein n=1 Tax=Terrabacter lapilli TaxID=436231 RepID=A0ABP5DKH7_9MICO